jgi:hypothetical protein
MGPNPARVMSAMNTTNGATNGDAGDRNIPRIQAQPRPYGNESFNRGLLARGEITLIARMIPGFYGTVLTETGFLRRPRSWRITT